MPVPIDWQQVWNQYGAVGVILFLGALALINAYKNRAATQDQTQKTSSDVIMVLAKSIEGLGQSIAKGDEMAARERNDNLMAIKEMTGRMQGVIETTAKISLSSSAVLTHIHSLSDMWEKEFPVLKTELGSVRDKASSLESTFTASLDARFEPVARLLTDVSALVRDWDERQIAQHRFLLQSLEKILLFIEAHIKSEEIQPHE